LSRIIYFLTGVKWSTQDIINGIFNQEFTRIKSINAPSQDHAMWTGKPGNWINYYTRRDADLTQALFGNLLMDQGYITSPDWVHEISL
jgi:ABC-type phosphate transport system substrate-binding protein